MNNQPPRLATLVMSLLLPKRFRDNVLGDLDEEYQQLSSKDVRQAQCWYWQQSYQTSMIYLSKRFGSVEFIGRINFYIPVMMFVIMVALVGLLSHMDDPSIISDTFWDDLLAGKIHTALFSQGFWVNWQAFFVKMFTNPGMLIDVPSVLITCFNLVVLRYLYVKQQASALKLAVWGYSLMIIPYIWGLIHISSHLLEPKQIGPIIAVMLLSWMYMLLPVSYIVHRRLKQQKLREQEYQQTMSDKDLKG